MVNVELTEKDLRHLTKVLEREHPTTMASIIESLKDATPEFEEPLMGSMTDYYPFDFSEVGNSGMPRHWYLVTQIVEGDYEWAEFRVYYSPVDRQYYWLGDLGCSCTSYDTDAYLFEVDFHNGSFPAMKRALSEWAEECSTPFEKTRALEDIHSFSEDRAAEHWKEWEN